MDRAKDKAMARGRARLGLGLRLGLGIGPIQYRLELKYQHAPHTQAPTFCMFFVSFSHSEFSHGHNHVITLLTHSSFQLVCCRNLKL